MYHKVSMQSGEMTWRNSAKSWCNKSHVDSQNDRVPSPKMLRPRFQMFAVKPKQTCRNIFQYFIISTPLAIEISFIGLPVLRWHIVVCGIASQICCSHPPWNRKIFVISLMMELLMANTTVLMIRMISESGIGALQPADLSMHGYIAMKLKRSGYCA